MEATEQYLIPKHLDAPPMFLIWESDTAAVFLACLFFGFLFGYLGFAILIGLIAARYYARLKSDGGRGVFTQFMYWHTPSGLWLPRSPPAYIREYIG